MFLKSLELMGFKSFPDKTLLTFGDGITAVLGPNGSGKSNISDAVRWVLGEQSTKQLRGSKMEDVIFNGTAARKSLGYAEVTLGIDNRDRALACDSDEVFVTRRYYRSGESEYQINRATVRLKDINELFMDTGLGRDGYSMISQGKISDIVAAKSDERRDIFEEAAGISRYRYRKAEAERKLDRVEDNLIRLRDILAELTDRVGPLEQQSKKAEQFLSFSEEKKTLEIGLWLDLLRKSKDALREQEHKIAAAEAQYDEVCRLIEHTELSIEANNAKGAALLTQMDAQRQKAHELEEQAAKNDGEIAVQENNRVHNLESIERLKAEIGEGQGSDSGILEDIAFRRGQIEEKKQAIAAMKQELEQSALSLEQLLLDASSKSSEHEALNRALTEFAEQISVLEVKKASALSSSQEIADRRGNADTAVQEKNAAVAALETELVALDADLKRVEEALTASLNSKEGYELRLTARRDKAESLREQMQKAEMDADAKDKRASLLAELERNLDGFAYSVKAIMKAKDEGRLRGIHGPLSRLITADKKYAIAVETALGARGQDVIVSNEEDAKAAIRYLKSTDSGRGTFVPLTEARATRFTEKGLDDQAGFVGMANELVTYDVQYDTVVQEALSHIAVAEDLDAAVSIARKYSYRFRIVTLDGQIVNRSGSLTGGSLAKNAGLMMRQGKIEQAKQEAIALRKKAQELGAAYQAAQAEVTKTQAELNAVQGDITTANEDKIRLLGEVKRVGEALQGAKLAREELLGESQNGEKRLTELAQTVAQCEQEIAALTEQNEQKKNELTALAGRQDELSQTREQLTAHNADVRMNILAVEKEIASLEDAVSLLDSRRADVSSRIDLLQGQITQYELANELLDGKIAEMRNTSEQLRAQAKECEQSVEQLAQSRMQLEGETNAMRQKEKDDSSVRERLGNEAARLTERKESMTREIDDAVAKLYDEYQLTRTEAEEIGVVPEDIPAANRRLAELKSKIRSLGHVNVAAIEEYKEVSARHSFLSEQLDDVEKSKAELLKLITELTEHMQVAFVDSFKKINESFALTFTDLFAGGSARLELSDPDHVLTSGIEIIVQPPGKKVSSIEQLSGGEKSLIAIAIYFAIMRVSPPPFCMLDEVEAALDDVNVDRFANYMRRMTGKTQFIAITHRRGTMEEADVLYGVTMQEKGVSKLLKLNVAQIEKELQLAK